MAQPAPSYRQESARLVVRRMHGMVTYGPWDLDIAWAMAGYGYDAVKWAEGQSLLAELVSSDVPAGSALASAMAWYDEAATTAQQVLAAQPHLLAKLGLSKTASG
jgi:hypothetical protein